MNQTFPHTDVYVRLAISKIHGVGVFAIRDIPQGTNIFKGDNVPVSWFSKEEIEKSNPGSEIMRLYDDFCIFKDGKYGCPPSFNNLSPGWYMNEPLEGEEVSVKADKNYDFFALRDIKVGEELTIRYSDFS